MPDFASNEIEIAWGQLESALDQLVGLTSGLDGDRLNWRPTTGPHAAEGANSLYILASHALGLTEQATLFMLCGEPGERDREAEFASSGATSEALEERWASLRERIPASLASIEESALVATFEHPVRGTESGRQLLLATATHVATHLGHAELTRDLIPAR
ncbi:MAG: DinB family protein [Chloroflexi bacterium]|nr:DinB family protein [Chloroflexota bacterium]